MPESNKAVVLNKPNVENPVAGVKVETIDVPVPGEFCVTRGGGDDTVVDGESYCITDRCDRYKQVVCMQWYMQVPEKFWCI